MKIVHKIAAFAILTSITLTGCSSANNSAPSTPNSTNQSNGNADQATPSKGKTTPTTTNVKDGVSNLLNVSNQLKKDIQSGDATKIKENAPKLEETWKTFEDGVKPKYPDQYAAIEKYLNPIVSGSKISPIDKKTLGKLNDQLIQTLNELQTHQKR
jgi:iron uptake system EfeUOB component EfeO/EfeM